MDWFKPGIKVRVNHVGLAVLLYECKSPPGYWGVLVKPLGNEVNHIIRCVPGTDITPYTNHCWNQECKNHGVQGSINSAVHETCEKCHWVICPDCRACKKDGCIDDMIRIRINKDS